MIVNTRDKIVQILVCLVAFIAGCSVYSMYIYQGKPFLLVIGLSAGAAILGGVLFTLICDYVRFVLWREK